MSQIFEGRLDGRGLRIAIIATRWNDLILDRLLDGARGALRQSGVSNDAVDVAFAPGAFELPIVAKTLAETGRYDGVIALGCVIRGATPHFDYVAGEAAKGIAAVAQSTGVPVAFGVLTVDTLEQALERAGAKGGNKGAEAALACLETITLCQAIKEA